MVLLPLNVLVGDGDRESPSTDHLGRVHPPVGVDDDDVARLQGRAHRVVVRALPPALGRRLEGPALFGFIHMAIMTGIWITIRVGNSSLVNP